MRRSGRPARPPNTSGSPKRSRTSSATDPGERSVELAQHWLQSAAPERAQKAAHYCVLAGEHALEALAPEEALGWFRRALDLLDELPEVDPSLRCDVLIGYGDAQQQVGDASYSETLLEASDIAQGLGDGGRMARAADANSRGFSSVVGQIEERRVAALEAALELCTEDQQRALLLSLLAVELSYGARLDRRLELSAEAVRLARASGNRHSLAWALARRQIAIAAPQTLSERIVETEEVIALADEIDDTLLRYWASVFQGLLALDVGDFETAARGREVQEAIAAETGQPMFLWVNTFAPALLATMAGDFELAEDLTNRSAGLGTEAGQPDVFAVYAAQIHVIRYEQGRLEEILEVQEQAVEEAPLLEAYSGALALSYCELGDTEKAREALRASAERGFDVTPTPSSKAALGFLSEVAARTGESDAAAVLYERLLPWRDQLSYTGVTMFGPVERYLGLTATCLGRHEDAAAHFRRSAATCERIEAPTWLARTRHEWALMLLARGGPGDRETAETTARAGARGRGALRVPLARASGQGRDRGRRCAKPSVTSREPRRSWPSRDRHGAPPSRRSRRSPRWPGGDRRSWGRGWRRLSSRRSPRLDRGLLRPWSRRCHQLHRRHCARRLAES